MAPANFNLVKRSVIVAALVLLIFGYLGYSHYTNPYAHWQTYRSPGYGITATDAVSLKYPPGWILTNRSMQKDGGLLSISIESHHVPSSPDPTGENFQVTIYTIGQRTKQALLPSYPVRGSTSVLGNNLRLWTYGETSHSKFLDHGRGFECANLRLLAPTANDDIPLKSGNFLSSEAGFCLSPEGAFTVKSYDEQLKSQEWSDAMKIYSSLRWK